MRQNAAAMDSLKRDMVKWRDGYVKYQDVCDKWQEEKDRNERLYARVKQQQKQIAICQTCHERPANQFFCGCRHLACCEQCLERQRQPPAASSAIYRCPVCFTVGQTLPLAPTFSVGI